MLVEEVHANILWIGLVVAQKELGSYEHCISRMFRLHDVDNNTLLDGIEIYQAISHFIPYDKLSADEKAPIDRRGKTPEQIAQAEKQAEESYYASEYDANR